MIKAHFADHSGKIIPFKNILYAFVKNQGSSEEYMSIILCSGDVKEKTFVAGSGDVEKFQKDFTLYLDQMASKE